MLTETDVDCSKLQLIYTKMKESSVVYCRFKWNKKSLLMSMFDIEKMTQ